MNHNSKSIRPFLGARDFKLSRNFYKDLGFDEIQLASNFSYFKSGDFGFYLQDAYVKEWIDNTMVFMEVEDVNQFWHDLELLELPAKYENVRLGAVREEHWGKECFVHDPSGILWHFGQFYNLK